MTKYLLALLCTAFLTGCLSYREVELVGIRSMKLTHLDTKGFTATVGVEMKNPNGYKIQVKDPDVDLSINGIGVGKAMLDSNVVLKRRSTEVYRVPLRVNFQLDQAGILPGLATGFLTGSIKLGVKGTVVGKAGFVRKRFPFSDEQAIDLR
ncbi:MAG: LEA type 2 family protein [Flavobacteriales bacterium]|jgi:LEA14-like dessication related protein|nr:LEA type 2 family protein [Flavobacteriales bacterium]MBP9159221.1 LEA type 2 family protein [Flavobacteriales bacterium]MCI1752215.1 LEA type 2 family protein [Flavobacteriales bacterium]